MPLREGEHLSDRTERQSGEILVNLLDGELSSKSVTMVSGSIRVPSMTGRPPIFPGTRSTRLQSFQFMYIPARRLVYSTYTFAHLHAYNLRWLVLS